jgi:8-oxo-dGTP pyrophosphatase MutT (NUDIX family)
MPKIQDYQVSLKVILKNKRGEALILKSEEYGSYKGYWDFPGGRIDEDEFHDSYEKIIAREIKEEVGNIKYKINCKPVAIGRHFVPAHITRRTKEYMDDLCVMYVFFEAEYLDGDICISDEHLEYKWQNLFDCQLDKLFVSGLLEGAEMYLGKRKSIF